MQTSSSSLLEFLRAVTQFVLPVYQRPYCWTAERECKQLFDDILEAGRSGDDRPHFLGAIMYVHAQPLLAAGWKPSLLIDGQQRLTTITLLLEALARHLDDREPYAGFTGARLRNEYLCNLNEDEGERRYRLLLTETDRTSLISVLRQQTDIAIPSRRISDNLAFFRHGIKRLGRDFDMLWKGLHRLCVLQIGLDSSRQNPQKIFESMNATGRALKPGDLIRNCILMNLDDTLQKRLYQDEWRPMEETFGAGLDEHFDPFIRHYLTLKTFRKLKAAAVYDTFKDHKRGADIVGLAREIGTFAAYYNVMALGRGPGNRLGDGDLECAFADFRALNKDAAWPFLLGLYGDHAGSRLTKEAFLRILRLVESYIFRRAVCGLHAGAERQFFAEFTPRIRPDRYLESVEAHFLLQSGNPRYPDDSEFRDAVFNRDFGGWALTHYMLSRLETHGRQEHVPVGDYTIEHILPRNPDLDAQWQHDLGSGWKAEQQALLHRIGNLTLTGCNETYSDLSFARKRDMPGGFAESPLRLNEDLRTAPVFDGAAIRKRSERIADLAVTIWPFPALSPAILQARYRGEPDGKGLTLDDHPFLRYGLPMHDLFQALRREVLAFGDDVREVPLRKYVAYKVRTNFMDVDPKKHFLRLSLNMKYRDLDDSRGLASDITGMERWGNGDVEVRLERLQDLPDVLDLIRQAYDRQTRGRTDP